MRRIKEEDEERRKRIELRKAALAGKNTKTVIQKWRPWPTMRNFKSQTVKVVALSISVATVALICNYVRPSLEMF